MGAKPRSRDRYVSVLLFIILKWHLTSKTDFVKLGIYAVFFFVLLTFYGLPIHITRDLFLTARSFAKRLTAFIKYRNATKDMNRRYPDATVEEIQREDT